MSRNVCVYILFIVLYSTHTLHSAESAKLPAFIKPCNRNSPDLDKCISGIIIELQPRLGRGIPEMQLVPLDPLFFPKAELHTDSFNAHFQDLNLYGANTFSVESFHLDLPNNMLSAEVLHPSIRQTGLYDIKGKLLFIELETKGPFEANYTQIRSTLKILGRRIEKNRKEYIKFETIEVKAQIDDFHMKIDNLFPNNADLSKTTNDVINENRKLLLPDFIKLIEETLSTVALSAAKTTFDQYSIDELLLDN